MPALPPKFLQRLQRIFPADIYESVVQTFLVPKPVTFRINWLDVRPDEVRSRLAREKVDAVPVAWYPSAFILRTGTIRDLQSTSVFRNGEIYIQRLSSMLPVLILDPKPGEKVLDMAAAPGSKTTQLACMMKGRGEIVANDKNRKRFFRLKANVEQQASGIVQCTLKNGAAFGRTHANCFDRVLVDAPCSSEGRFLLAKKESYRYWSPRKIKEMAGVQKRLLLAGVNALRPGGVLVYSTCTFAPEENELVLDWVLRRIGGQVEVDKLDIPLPRGKQGLIHWDGKELHPETRKFWRILPSAVLDGFCILRLRKRAAHEIYG
ncbi:MAG: RsmB/NOP family class I SAM-dependent RNA methyltransferase [Candidatus Omnitrophica bacterium]|nr:RsmB/NOP family class I SAM-dependent RNA methyltransferase [Candidatus Omnitrophota bacterium]